MKLSFSTLACPEWTLEQIAAGAMAAGIDGVDFRGLGPEIDITRLSQFTTGLDATLALLRQRNLQMPCLSTSVTLVSPAPERWQMMLEECHRYAHLAQRSGTPYLRVFGGIAPKGMTHAEARGLAERHLRQLVLICRPCRCIPLLETHDDWCTSDLARELLHAFDPADAGILWNVEHSVRRGERPVDTAQAIKPYLRHTHFKDSLKVDGKIMPRLLGQGELPLPECMAALRHIGYDGWYCLENEKRWMAQDCAEPEIALPQFAQYMRSL